MGQMFDQFKSKQFETFFSQDVENGHFDVILQCGDEKLHAHKHMLAGLSKPFAALFSERWSNKEEPLKIERYSFNDFKEFLNVFYHCKPKLANENIFTMVDMAEFYDVAQMMSLCDEFLSCIQLTTKNFCHMFEFSQKYSSLPKFQSSIESFMVELAPKNVFQLYEFSRKYSALSKFQSSIESFMVKNLPILLKSDEFVNIKKEMLHAIVDLERLYSHEEEFFEAVYKWAEHQAIIKKYSMENEVFDINQAIKENLSEILPKICFERMTYYFMNMFVVSKGFIFSSSQDLSDNLQKSKHGEVCVKVATYYNETLTGRILCDFSMLLDIYDTIKPLVDKYCDCEGDKDYNLYSCWHTTKPRPSKPSQLKKNNNVTYYLIFDKSDYLAVKETSQLDDTDYLLAEMVGDAKYLEEGCMIEAVHKF